MAHTFVGRVGIVVVATERTPARGVHQFTDGGFEWTYEGDAPQQLALALLADHLQDDHRALELSGDFARQVVAQLDNEWVLTSSDIERALNDGQ